MTSERIEPSVSSISFSCPHCGAYAHQSWLRLYAEPINEDGTPFRPESDLIARMRDDARALKDEAKKAHLQFCDYAAKVQTDELFLSHELSDYRKDPQLANLHTSHCYACKKFTVWAADRMIYPYLSAAAISPNSDMKDDIQLDFKEAALILDTSPRGGAALLRLCIQKLCGQLGESGKDINADIASLVQKGLDKRIQRALDIVRVIGNDAVHPGQMDLRDNRDTALELARLVNLIAEVLITQPKHIDAMYEKLPESKRKAIEHRDKNGS